jgi:hypothetical protein
VVAVPRQAGEVAVYETARHRAAALEWRIHGPGDHRVPPVGADGQRRGGAEGGADAAGDPLDAAHPPAVGQQRGHLGGAADLGAGRLRRVEQQRV